MLYPRMVKIRQQLDGSVVSDIALAVKAEFGKSRLSSEIKPGSKVAITAGSRGITDIVAIISSLVREVKSRGGNPFIVPAMGSWGQRKVNFRFCLIMVFRKTSSGAFYYFFNGSCKSWGNKKWSVCIA
jgi:hypothetical protein